MTLPRRAPMTLSVLVAFLLGGILGVSWWSWRHHQGKPALGRFPRFGAALVVAGLLTITVGTAWRLTVPFESVRACSPPGGSLTARGNGTLTPSLAAQKVITWPETGIGLMYARAVDGHVCKSRSADFFVAVPASVVGERATIMGDLVLSPGYETSKEERAKVAAHEARHRPQWAVATVIGGPFAFPVAYAIDDFFFPGARNHFERMAGLEAGLYTHTGDGPVLAPAQIAVLVALGTILVAVVARAVRRRVSASARGEAESGRSATQAGG
jgi:hypothetical protein